MPDRSSAVITGPLVSETTAPLAERGDIWTRETKAASRIALIPRCIPAEREVFLVYYPSLVTRCRLGWRRTWCSVYFRSVAPPCNGKTQSTFAHFLQLFDKGRLFLGGRGLTYTNFLRPGCSADTSHSLERSEESMSCAKLCFFLLLRLNKSEPLLLNLVEPARAQQPCLFEK